MTTATTSKPEVEAKPKERSTSPDKNEAPQKTPVDSPPQSTDATQVDRTFDAEARRFPRIREHDDRKIFVGNLPVQTNSDDLVEHFSQAGAVEYATVIKSRDGVPRRYGFVVFSNKEDSVKAVDTLNNMPFGDSPLVVQSIVPKPRRSRVRRSPTFYSNRRNGRRRSSPFDQRARQHVESGGEDEDEQRQRQSSRPYGRRSYRPFRSSGRRPRNPNFSSQSRQDTEDITPNTQGTQTQDAQGEGPAESERSQSYSGRVRSIRRTRQSFPRRPRGEDSGFVATYSSSAQSDEYNGGRISPRGDEPRSHRGHYQSSQEYGYRNNRRYRTSEERGSFRPFRRSGPHPSEYRSRPSRGYFAGNQQYDGRQEPLDNQYSKLAVFVGNLPYRVDKDSLADFFSEKGYSVHDAYVVCDMNENSKGYGFVEFESHEDQSKAIRNLDGCELYDRVIAIKPAVISRRGNGLFGHQQREE